MNRILFQITYFFLLVGFFELVFRFFYPIEHRVLHSHRPPSKIIEEPNHLMQQSPHPLIGLELLPNLDHLFFQKEFKTNSQGLRDKEYQVSVKLHPRIIGIGDSVMMGWGVGQEEMYLSILEKKLHELGKEVEVINFGVQGYNAIQEYHVLHGKAMDYQPDFVVIGYVGNDVTSPNYHPPKERLHSFSYFANFLFLRLQLLMGEIEQDQIYSWKPFQSGEDPQTIFEAYQAMAHILQKKGIKVLFLMDSRYQHHPGSHAQMEKFAKNLGWETINLRALYRSRPEDATMEEDQQVEDEHHRLYSLEGDSHPNAAWHQRTAQVLLEHFSPLL